MKTFWAFSSHFYFLLPCSHAVGRLKFLPIATCNRVIYPKTRARCWQIGHDLPHIACRLWSLAPRGTGAYHFFPFSQTRRIGSNLSPQTRLLQLFCANNGSLASITRSQITRRPLAAAKHGAILVLSEALLEHGLFLERDSEK